VPLIVKTIATFQNNQSDQHPNSVKLPDNPSST